MTGTTPMPRLARGVVLGAPDNPIVVVPDRSPVCVDEHTHALLRRLATGETVLLLDDDRTRESLVALAAAGVLDVDHPQPSGSDHPRYAPTLTDLIVRRPSRTLTAIVAGLARIVTPLTSRAGIVLGLAQVVAITGVVIVGFPVREGLSYVLDNPVRSLSVVVAILTASGLLHEAGHYAVARGLGHRPAAGIGLYLAAPVLYVDLTVMETHPRGERIRSALAGPAIDGYTLSALALCYHLRPSPVLVVALFIGSSAAILALRPGDKTDGYWAIRDWLGARRVAATWATPVKLAREFGAGTAVERRFIIVLASVYAVTAAIIAINFGRWLLEFIDMAVADPRTWWRFARLAAIYGGVTAVYGAAWWQCARPRSRPDQTIGPRRGPREDEECPTRDRSDRN
ncbi:hypothetical protein ACWF82_28800 [Nocardia sp. NPDC055053]